MADVMRIGAGLLGLKIENMHAIAAASKFLRGQGCPEDSARMKKVSRGTVWEGVGGG